MSTVAVLGAGVMGGAVLSALLADGLAPAMVRATTLDPQAARRLSEQGVAVVDNVAAVTGADVVIVAVKPADVVGVLGEVASHLGSDTVVVSLAAGVALASLEAVVPAGTAVVRVMPNTPALVGAGMSVLSPGASCTPAQLEQAKSLLSSCGRVEVVPEYQQDAVTALSGSGPAYFFYVVEAMIEAGVLLGLARSLATELAIQTAVGAATMLRQSTTHPSLLREQVTSPGGTTVAALRTLDAHGVRSAFAAAMEVAARRSAELGR